MRSGLESQSASPSLKGVLIALLVAVMIMLSPSGHALRPAAAAPLMVFEPNQGQIEADAQFLARAQGYALLLGPSGAQLHFGAGAASLTLAFEGADEARLEGVERLVGKSHYLRGPSNQWLTGVPHYRKVAARGVYPGIDVVYYTTAEGQLEYDFVVAPGADPQRIAMRFGDAPLVSDEAGDLVIDTAAGPVRLRAPVSFQTIAGERRAVDSRYELSNGLVHVALGDYDTAHALTIDPVIDYLTLIGSNGFDVLTDVQVAADGTVVMAGDMGADFATTADAFQSLNNGFGDVSIIKFDGDSQTILYSTYIGGEERDGNARIALDAAGNVLICGATRSPDFPLVNPAQPDLASGDVGGFDLFVSVLNPVGDGLVYSTYLGGSGEENRCDIALGDDGGAYVSGFTSSPDLPVPAPLFDTFGGLGDGFVARYSAIGELLSATYLGGDNVDLAVGVAVASDGSVYVAGDTGSSNFPVTPGSAASMPPGGRDSYLVKLSADLGTLQWGSFVGSNALDEIADITVDAADNAVVAGRSTSGQLDGATQAPAYPFGGGRDAFYAVISSDGSEILQHGYFGGSDVEDGRAVAVHPDGSVILGGESFSADLPVTGNAFQRQRVGESDAFLAWFTPEGDGLRYASYFGGSFTGLGGSVEEVNAIAVGPGGEIYAVGEARGEDFPTVNPGLMPPDTDNHAFILKLSDSDELVVAATALSVNEVDGTVPLQVVRSGSLAGPASVDFTLVPDTAMPGTDYLANSGVLSWAGGQGGVRAVSLNLVNDRLGEEVETFSVVFSNPTGNVTMAADATVVTVMDDDGGPQPGAFIFADAAYSTLEDNSTLSVNVDRIGGTAGEVSVRLRSVNGTAVAPDDFSPVDIVLVFADGVNRRNLQIGVVDDDLFEASPETFTLTLSEPTGGSALGDPSEVIVRLFDNDAPPTPTPTSTATPSPTLVVTPTPTPTAMPTATPSPTLVVTPTPTTTPSPTLVVTPTPTPTPAITPTPSPTPTATPAPTPTPVVTPTPTPTPTSTPTATPSPSPLITPAPSATASPTPVVTPTPMPSSTPTATPTATPVPTVIVTPTTMPSVTPPATLTPTPTATAVPLPPVEVIGTRGGGSTGLSLLLLVPALWLRRRVAVRH